MINNDCNDAGKKCDSNGNNDENYNNENVHYIDTIRGGA